jgi:hypothetical protein
MRRALVLLLLSGCAAPNTRTLVALPGAASVRETTVEVVNATGRELPAPRSGLVDEIARVTAGGAASPFSTADTFAAAAAAGLRERGVNAVSGRHPELPVLRLTILDFEIRDRGAAGAVAFVSARYLLLDTEGEALWEAAETRLPSRLGGSDLTRSELARIAAKAVDRALSSFPASTQP